MVKEEDKNLTKSNYKQRGKIESLHISVLFKLLNLDIEQLFRPSNPKKTVFSKRFGGMESEILFEVKNKYKELIKSYHPDLGGDPERMTELNLVYQTLENRLKSNKLKIYYPWENSAEKPKQNKKVIRKKEILIKKKNGRPKVQCPISKEYLHWLMWNDGIDFTIKHLKIHHRNIKKWWKEFNLGEWPSRHQRKLEWGHIIDYQI